MEVYTRTKPTKHRQDCAYCNEWMEKGEEQTVTEERDWGFGHAFIYHQYFHPRCALKLWISSEKFVNHFKHAYSRELDAKSFKEVFDQRLWIGYSAYYIVLPFRTFASLHLDDTAGQALLDEIFTGIVFDKVMTSAS